MGFHLMIHRVRRIYPYDDTKYQIKLIREDGAEVPLDNPVEVREEFYLGRGVFPIHYWFIKRAEELYPDDDNEDMINIDYASNFIVGISDLIELRDAIKKVLDSPKLARKILPLPKYEDDVLSPSEEDYDVEILEFPYEQLNKLISEKDEVECFGEFIYEAG